LKVINKNILQQLIFNRKKDVPDNEDMPMITISREMGSGGRPIAEFGLIKQKIGEMAIRCFIMESMVYRTGGLIDLILRRIDRHAEDVGIQMANGIEEYNIEDSINKIFCSEMAGYVVDEAVTTALARTRRLDIAKKTGSYIMDSPRILKLHVSEEEFNRAWKKFQELRKPLSFTDTTTLTLMEEHGVEKIMSFDSDFDGLAQRIS